jgi:biopolymer transport protein ExbD
MKFRKKQATTKQEIPTASLPDIIFMLLIFFMLTTVLREFDVQVEYTLPEAYMIERIDNKRLISYIWVGRDGRIQIDDNLVRIDDINAIMYQKRVEIPNLIVSMRIDRYSEMGVVTDIQQQLREADALRINYSSLHRL